MVSGRLVKYRKKAEGEGSVQLDAPLPAHHDSDLIYYFGVRFPNKEVNILSSMRLVIALTLLVFLAVLFFIYTIYIILQQKQLSELQRDFINNMTHEFKTPIATINISTDVFLQSPLIRNDPRLSRYATIIKEQIMRLNVQVEKVLQLAKLEREHLELNLEEVDVSELIKGLQPSLELKTEEKKGVLHLNLQTDHAWVRADRLHLTNVLHNLVDNGVKYSKSPPNIEVSLSLVNSHVELAVKDQGIGIAPEHQKHIFKKFYRVPTGNVHNVKGFGLGLYYVHTICREHRWKLHLDSEPGRGTTVSIHMPLLSEHS
jgi:Signal transduction histidine kinase